MPLHFLLLVHFAFHNKTAFCNVFGCFFIFSNPTKIWILLRLTKCYSLSKIKFLELIFHFKCETIKRTLIGFTNDTERFEFYSNKTRFTHTENAAIEWISMYSRKRMLMSIITSNGWNKHRISQELKLMWIIHDKVFAAPIKNSCIRTERTFVRIFLNAAKSGTEEKKLSDTIAFGMKSSKSYGDS